MENIYSIRRLVELMEEMKLIFTDVRIVDPSTTTVLEIKDNEIIDTSEVCYQHWGKNKRCKNCVSMRALELDTTLSKLENSTDNISRVTSKAIMIDYNGKPTKVIMEIINDTTQEVIDLADIKFSNEIIYEDSLTKAFNRRFFDDRVYRYYGLDNEAEKLGFIICDMTKFKNINDTYGHQKGDEMLQAFTNATSSVLEEDDLLIRIGGDEFLVVLRRNPDFSEIIGNIKNEVSKVQVDKDDNLYLGVNCGYAFTEQTDNKTINLALADADEMMYKDKKGIS